jgi:hypothetical protein
VIRGPKDAAAKFGLKRTSLINTMSRTGFPGPSPDMMERDRRKGRVSCGTKFLSVDPLSRANHNISVQHCRQEACREIRICIARPSNVEVKVMFAEEPGCATERWNRP